MKIHFFEKEYYGIYPASENIMNCIKYIDATTPVIKNIIGSHALNIWCRGSSGAILAALLAKNLPQNDIVICHVKKEGESSHHGNSFSIVNNSSRKAINMIIDDFIRSGETINAIWEYAQCCVNSINILFVKDMISYSGWTINFVPNNLVVMEDDMINQFEHLEPTRITHKTEDITDFLNF